MKSRFWIVGLAILVSNFFVHAQTAPKDGDADLISSDVLPGAKTLENTTLRIVADHERHGVTSPTALAFDEQGVLYVAETHRFRHGVEDNRYHRYWMDEDISNQRVEDRMAMIEKWSHKFPDGYFTEKAEVVRRLSDAGEDGVFAQAKVFSDDFRDELDGTLAGVFAYDGVVYVASIPEVSGLVDEDGDGVAERKVVFQDGFGVKFSLSGHDLNGFALGPDGMIYGTVGDRGFHLTTKEGVDYEYPAQGAVFRFDPDGTNFEVIHTGLRNPKEIDFDEYGNAFSVDNNADFGDKSRVVYLVEGADSGWRMGHQILGMFYGQLGLEKRPPFPWMDERMWDEPNALQPKYLLPPVGHITNGPSGLVYHSGHGFLASEGGRFFICDYKGAAARSGIWSFGVKPKGAGMQMVDERWLLKGVAATDVTTSWDGRVFISDFDHGWTSHEAGRILELKADSPSQQEVAGDAAKLIKEGFEDRTAEALAELLRHADFEVRTRAHLELTRRSEGMALLYQAASEGEGFERLHGIWGLGVIARRGEAARARVDPDEFVELPDERKKSLAADALKNLLKDGDAEIRAQAIKMLGDAGASPDSIPFSGLLADASPRVRMFTAITAGKMKSVGAMTFVWKMLIANDDKDPYLRHAGSYALSLMSKPEQLYSLSYHKDESLRLAAAIALGRMEHERVSDFLYDDSAKIANEALVLIHDRMIEEAIPQVVKIVEKGGRADWTEMQWRRAMHLVYRAGGEQEAKLILDIVMREDLSMATRSEAVRLLERWNKAGDIDQSLGRYWPMGERSKVDIASMISPELDEWMKFDGELIEAALQLIKKLEAKSLKVSVKELNRLLNDTALSGKARALALELLVENNADDLLEILFGLVSSDRDELAVKAMEELKSRDRGAFFKALEAAQNSDSVVRKQAIWELLKDVEGDKAAEWYVRALNELEKNKGVGVDALELLETAEMRKESGVVEALASVKKSLESDEDSLSVWMPMLMGGDAAKGKQLFESHPAAQCSRCHHIKKNKKGEMAGPNLAGIGARLTPEKLLESMVMPSAEVAAGYGVASYKLQDGSVVSGVLLKEKEDAFVVKAGDDEKILKREDVAEVYPPVSSMPPMGALLDKAEIRDLVAWLEAQK